jgi:hypothetical protein
MTGNPEKTKKYFVRGSALKYKGIVTPEGGKIELSDAEAKMLSKQITLEEVKNG